MTHLLEGCGKSFSSKAAGASVNMSLVSSLEVRASFYALRKQLTSVSFIGLLVIRVEDIRIEDSRIARREMTRRITQTYSS